MRLTRSRKLFSRAQRILPGGVDSPVRAFKSVGGTPLFIERAYGAQGGEASTDWTNVNSTTWSTVASRLASAGVTNTQVQVLWMKHARRNPADSGAFPLHSQALQGDEEIILRDAKLRYPNLKIAYLSSRTRAYTSDASTLNPEPYAYEGAFAVRWLIQDQSNGDAAYDAGRGAAKALLLWGPYFWADVTTPQESPREGTWRPRVAPGQGL